MTLAKSIGWHRMITPPDADTPANTRRTTNVQCLAVADAAVAWAEDPPTSREGVNDAMRPLKLERAYRAALKRVKTTREERAKRLHMWTAAEWGSPEGGCAATLWIAITNWSFERTFSGGSHTLPPPPPRRHVVLCDCYMPARRDLVPAITRMADLKPGFLLGGAIAVDCGNNLLHNAAFRVYYNAHTTTIRILDPTATAAESVEEWLDRVQTAQQVTAELRITEIAALYK
jgi:hypothetical protein